MSESARLLSDSIMYENLIGIAFSVEIDLLTRRRNELILTPDGEYILDCYRLFCGQYGKMQKLKKQNLESYNKTLPCFIAHIKKINKFDMFGLSNLNKIFTKIYREHQKY